MTNDTAKSSRFIVSPKPNGFEGELIEKLAEEYVKAQGSLFRYKNDYERERIREGLKAVLAHLKEKHGLMTKDEAYKNDDQMNLWIEQKISGDGYIKKKKVLEIINRFEEPCLYVKEIKSDVEAL